MSGRIDFTRLEGPHVFQNICERLFARLHPDFHPVDQAGGDQGVDGFIRWGETVLQWTHRNGNVPLRAFREYLEKARTFGSIKKWLFISSKPLSVQTWQFFFNQTRKYHLKEMTRSEIYAIFGAMKKVQNSSLGGGSEELGAWRKQL